ncbi:hypothetical protein ILUMI_02494 [Ignelater luminosus]|uniref:Uncharacterized protein n=1 Tax=Ignelater luminosus TaxID=2038154 RepID=A0A8K0DDC7_IGNLU|nr:hypothetical protein ILUMI_02494 [Ignelater luminosus]
MENYRGKRIVLMCLDNRAPRDNTNNIQMLENEISDCRSKNTTAFEEMLSNAKFIYSDISYDNVLNNSMIVQNSDLYELENIMPENLLEEYNQVNIDSEALSKNKQHPGNSNEDKEHEINDNNYNYEESETEKSEDEQFEELNTSEINENSLVSEDENNPEKESTSRQNKSSAKNKRKVNYLKRMKGEGYLGFRHPKGETKTIQDVARNRRKMKSTCTSQLCKKFKNRFCHEFKETDRKNIFNYFWEKLDWKQKEIYIAGLCSRQDTQKKTVLEHQSRRDRSYLYSLRKGDKHLQVCKRMFLNTLGIGEWYVYKCVSNCRSEENHSSPSSTIKSSRSIDSEDLKFVREFLRDLPKLPSHYCRHDTKNEYLEDNFVTYADLYKVYGGHCTINNRIPMSRKTLVKCVKDMNIGIFNPKRDRCDTCVQYESGNLNEEADKKKLEHKKKRQKIKKRHKMEDAMSLSWTYRPSKPVLLLIEKTKQNIVNVLEYLEQHPEICVCGEIVLPNSHHGLSCKKVYGKISHHRRINEVIRHTLNTAGYPSTLEPSGLSRTDIQRPDGMTHSSWSEGKPLVWDFTHINTTFFETRLKHSKFLQKYVDHKASSLLTPVFLDETWCFSKGSMSRKSWQDGTNTTILKQIGKDQELKRKERGFSDEITNKEGDVVLVMWLDNKAVCLASNYIKDKVKRWEKKNLEYIKISRLEDYNHGMGGVDFLDQFA